MCTLIAASIKVENATATRKLYAASLQVTAPSFHWPNGMNSIRVGIDTKQTIRSLTARLSMKTLTRFLRNSAQLTVVMMTIALPSNVSSISKEKIETWKMIAGVQRAAPSPSDEVSGNEDAVVVMFSAPLSSASRCNDASV